MLVLVFGKNTIGEPAMPRNQRKNDAGTNDQELSLLVNRNPRLAFLLKRTTKEDEARTKLQETFARELKRCYPMSS